MSPSYRSRIGGWRPILQCVSMYRVWARARLHFVKAWELAPGPRGGARAYWWGGVGKACDRAMWQHALRGEASQGWRLGAATVVCDGSKF